MRPTGVRRQTQFAAGEFPNCQASGGSSWICSAGRVGSAGRVVGLDVEPANVALAREFAAERGLVNVELLWALAADARAVVIEANFRPHSEYETAKLSDLAAHPVEVYGACPPELAIKRYNARTSHPVHVVTALHLNDMAEYDRPVGIGTLVTVDTTVPVDVPAVAAAVRARSR